MMRKRNVLLWISAALVYLFLYLPLVIVVVFSFNDSRLNAEWVGFTWKWYGKLFHNREMLAAAMNSLIIAGVSAAAATLLGTLAGIAMHQSRLRLLQVLVLAPIAMPEILMGVSLLVLFIMVNMTLGLLSIMLAHVTFCIGFVALAVQAADVQYGPGSGGGGPGPGGLALALFPRDHPAPADARDPGRRLMAFTLSIDDFVITFFTAGVGSSTLPLQIYSMVKIAVTPEVNAVSTLLMLLTLVVITVASRLSPAIFRGE